ncbi:MAG TPA: hypothetical protein VE978_22420 [Chitinophagales bacterium]|nr:hypothetical protein [Chitinophagales bacterium]
MPSVDLIADSSNLIRIVYRGETVFLFNCPISTDDTFLLPPKKLPNGKYLAFYGNDTSKIALEISYKNGQIDGKENYYFKSGKLWSTTTFINGVMNGEFVEYFNTGKIHFEGSDLNGRINGKYTEYDIDGNRIKEATYKNGKSNGTYKIWDCDGKLMVDAYYRNGKMKKYNNKQLK